MDSPKISSTAYKGLPTETTIDIAKEPYVQTTATPCTFSWHYINYKVHPRSLCGSKGESKQILHQVSGRCAPGQLTAIMGPSGSGKTTLLDILADRVASGTKEGTVYINGQPRKEGPAFRSLATYVAQEDSLMGSFTVLETLRFAAKLSIASNVSAAEREKRVQNAVQDMGLNSCLHTLVGDIFRKGISGGQKRRLSIAIELLRNPTILLLDEPTSGLDSSSTFHVMRYIEKLCVQQNRTVVCTIHQPSSVVYNMFTNVMILSQGRTVYFGTPQIAFSYFQGIGYTCPQYSNPAEYYVALINTDFDSKTNLDHFTSSFDQSSLLREIESNIENDIRNTDNSIRSNAISFILPSSWNQFIVLMHRNTLNNIRNPGIYWVRLFMYVMLCFMVGTMYLSSNTDITDQDIVPLLFYVQAFLVFMSVAVLPFFIEQRSVFVRERTNNSLSVISYAVANFIAALPGIFLIAVISSVLVVYLAGLNSFGYFLLNLFLSLVVAESLMHVIGAVSPHYIIGIAVGAGLFGMFMLCEGFMVPYKAIPKYWVWVYHIAFHTYSFESFVYEHFRHINTPSAKAILERLNMTYVNVDRDMIILACYAIFLQIVFIFILHKFHTGRR